MKASFTPMCSVSVLGVRRVNWRRRRERMEREETTKETPRRCRPNVWL